MAIAFFLTRWTIIGGLGGYASAVGSDLLKHLAAGAAVLVYALVRLLIPFRP